MKKIIFFLLITINLFSKTAEQKNSFKNIINSQPTITEIYYNRLEVSTRLPAFTENFIDIIADKRPEVPAYVWQTIKDDLDYTPFKNLVIQVLNNNFTDAQMQQTITEYNGKPYIPILNLNFRNELQLTLQQFDVVLLNQINVILIANGYQSLTL